MEHQHKEDEFVELTMGRVFNRGKKEYSEEYNGSLVKIPVGCSVEMEYFDAMAFKSNYAPLVRNNSGQDITEKALTVEKFIVRVPKSDQAARAGLKSVYRCMVDKKDFPTKEEYEAHVAEQHIDRMADVNAKEQIRKRV